MFKWLFYYWFNPTDKPTIIAKLNLWSYVNIRLFKIKIISSIVYFILGLNNLYFKKLKIFHKNISFEYLYLKLINYIVFIILFFLILLVL